MVVRKWMCQLTQSLTQFPNVARKRVEKQRVREGVSPTRGAIKEKSPSSFEVATFCCVRFGYGQAARLNCDAIVRTVGSMAARASSTDCL